MKIYTKGGDKGQTSLLGGTRVQKSNPRIETYGSIDELNSNLGMLRDLVISDDIKEDLLRIQNILFVIRNIHPDAFCTTQANGLLSLAAFQYRLRLLGICVEPLSAIITDAWKSYFDCFHCLGVRIARPIERFFKRPFAHDTKGNEGKISELNGKNTHLSRFLMAIFGLHLVSDGKFRRNDACHHRTLLEQLAIRERRCAQFCHNAVRPR